MQQFKLNALDRLVGYFSPQRGLARARARVASDLLREYDAAGYGRRTETWTAGDGSANREISKALQVLRKRHREQVRNNPWAARAKQAIVSNAVASGITGELKGTKRAAGQWRQWASSSQCDADGVHSLYGLQGVVLGAVVESGDALVMRQPISSAEAQEIPLRIKVLEGDFLDHTKTMRLANDHVVLQGVEFDSTGRRVNYWLFDQHPGDTLSTAMVSKPVPASDVAHIYRMDRPNQVRGVPWGAPVMTTMRDLDGYEDALLFRQKLANCFMAFVHDHTPDISGASTSKLPMPETLEPGLIAGLPAGKDVKFAEPPEVEGHGEMIRIYLHRIAAGYGITYQALTGILTDVNFSSGKMGRGQMDRNIDQWQWHMMIPQFCEVVAGWWMQAASLTGMRTDSSSIVWTPPKREMLDPPKETKAALDQVRAGFKSLQEVQREWGFHPSQVLDEIEASNREIDKRGLILDSDPRNSRRQGDATSATQETDE